MLWIQYQGAHDKINSTSSNILVPYSPHDAIGGMRARLNKNRCFQSTNDLFVSTYYTSNVIRWWLF